MNQPPSRIGIFWDIETCPPPSVLSGHEVVDSIRRVALSFGIVTMLKAYVECTREPTRWFQDPLYESELQLSGVSLTQCLINDGTPSGTAVGRTLAADMLAYAIDNPAPSIIMLISGDRHIAYPLSLLRLRRYDIVVISPSNVHAGLKSQASESFVWEHHILGGVRDAQDYHPSIPSTQNHNPTLSVRSSGPGQSTPLGFRPAVGSQDFADGYRYKNERTYMNQTPSAFSAREQPPWTGRSEAPSPSSISFNQRNQFVRPTSIYNGSDNVHRGPPQTHDANSHKPPSMYDGRSSDTPRPEVRKESGEPSTTNYAGDADKTRNNELDSTANFPFIEKQPSEEASSVGPGGGGAKTTMPATSFNVASPAFVPRASGSVSSPAVATVPVPQTPKSTITNGIQQPPQTSGSQSNLTPQVTGGPLADGILQPLLNRLESLHMEGKTRPLRSVVGMELSSNNKAMYKQAGVAGFSEYVALAEKRGMVNLGGTGGSAWIELNPSWREASAWL